MQANAKASVLKRFMRIEGQVRGLARMVEDDRYCIDIVTQLSARAGRFTACSKMRSSPIMSPIASSTPLHPATRASSGERSAN